MICVCEIDMADEILFKISENSQRYKSLVIYDRETPNIDELISDYKKRQPETIVGKAKNVIHLAKAFNEAFMHIYHEAVKDLPSRPKFQQNHN